MEVFQTVRDRIVAGVALVALGSLTMGAQEHGRKYKAPPPTAHIVVTVEKGFNSKPMMNAAVIFHAIRDGKDDGNLEVKTDPDGRATIDLIEVGSKLTVQVIASGFATYAETFDVDTDKKDLLVKMQRPKAQLSAYQDNEGKPSDLQPGQQVHIVPRTTPPPAAVAPPPDPKKTPVGSPE